MDRLVGIFGLLFAGAIVLRVVIVYRKNGRWPVILSSNDAAHDYVHKVIVWLIGLEGLNIIAFRLQAFSDGLLGLPVHRLYAYLGPFPALEHDGLQAIGLAVAAAGLIWSVVCQHQMGKDWRVGFADESDNAELVTSGAFSRIRHPIYTGFIVITWGLFLATPNGLTLVLAVLTTVILSIEARLEEAFLLARHGEAYKKYLARTRRWL